MLLTFTRQEPPAPPQLPFVEGADARVRHLFLEDLHLGARVDLSGPRLSRAVCMCVWEGGRGVKEVRGDVVQMTRPESATGPSPNMASSATVRAGRWPKSSASRSGLRGFDGRVATKAADY